MQAGAKAQGAGRMAQGAGRRWQLRSVQHETGHTFRASHAPHAKEDVPKLGSHFHERVQKPAVQVGAKRLQIHRPKVDAFPRIPACPQKKKRQAGAARVSKGT